MKITAQDMVRFGVIDTIVPEPTGGGPPRPPGGHSADRRSHRERLVGSAGAGSRGYRKQRREKSQQWAVTEVNGLAIFFCSYHGLAVSQDSGGNACGRHILRLPLGLEGPASGSTRFENQPRRCWRLRLLPLRLLSPSQPARAIAAAIAADASSARAKGRFKPGTPRSGGSLRAQWLPVRCGIRKAFPTIPAYR